MTSKSIYYHVDLLLQIVSLLILSGDIEQNPGPVSGTSNGGKFVKEFFDG